MKQTVRNTILGGVLGALALSSTAFAAGDAATGQTLFNSKGCVACHTVDGTPRVGPTAKGLFGKMEAVTVNGVEQQITVDEAYLKESILTPNAKITKGFPPAMVLMSPVSDAEVDHLVAYIKTLK